VTFDPNIDLPRNIYIERVRDRTIHEMLGIVKGVVCDGVVSEEECALFRNWVEANAHAIETWPGDVLAQRILAIYEDGVVDVDERHELYELFCDTVGAGGTEDAFATTVSSKLPLDDPVPEIIFINRTFVLTGKFFYGTRSKCEKAIEVRGGQCRSTVTKQSLTLVIGQLGSEAWIQSPYGRKIETAMRHKQSGLDILIVSEESWHGALIGGPTNLESRFE
jgi:NAD-dependent DNA ligase